MSTNAARTSCARLSTTLSLLLSVAHSTAALAQSSLHEKHHAVGQAADTAFRAMQERGKQAMGVDQYVSTHHFTPLKDGGRIQLETVATDTAGITGIRKHMRDIAHAFGTGDFSTPMFVHMKKVPGTAAMARMKDRITYTPRDLPRGGALVITTHNADALAAVHQFMAFQQKDHRAGPE